MKKIAIFAILAMLAYSKNACADGLITVSVPNTAILKVVPERSILAAELERADTSFELTSGEDAFLEVTKILMGPELSSEEFPNGSTDSYL